MRFISTVAVLAGLVVASSVAPTSAGAVADASITTNEATVTLSVGDVAFDGPGCVKAPVTWGYAKEAGRSNWTTIRMEVSANQSAAANGLGGTLSSPYWDPPTATGLSTSFDVCPRSIDVTRGPLLISGTLKTSNLSGAESYAPIPNGTVNMTYNPTRLSKPRARLPKGIVPMYEIRGDATAQTLTKGTVPAGGTLVLQLKKPGRTAWVSGLTSGVDSYGQYSFRLYYPERYAKGTQFRVALRDCGWCTNGVSRSGRL